jgi:hypothetical protein
MIKSELENFFVYKNNDLYRKKDGKLVGNVNTKGYKRVYFQGKYRYAHRIIFLIHHGYLPEFIDHIDGNSLNNSINNLRPVNISQNGMNRKINNNNKTNIKNVCFDKSRNLWVVQVKANKKLVFKGCYKDLELAELVALEARNKFHQNFARSL